MSKPNKGDGLVVFSQCTIGKTVFKVQSEFNAKTPYSKILEKILISKINNFK